MFVHLPCPKEEGVVILGEGEGEGEGESEGEGEGGRCLADDAMSAWVKS